MKMVTVSVNFALQEMTDASKKSNLALSIFKNGHILGCIGKTKFIRKYTKYSALIGHKRHKRIGVIAVASDNTS